MRNTRSQTLFPPATNVQPDIAKKRQGRGDESLRLLLAIYGGGSVLYAVLSFIGLHLFDFPDETNSGKTPNQTAQLEEIRFPSGFDGNIFGMGFCVLGSELYLVGGRKPASNDGVEDTDLPGCENLEMQSCDSDTKGGYCSPLLASNDGVEDTDLPGCENLEMQSCDSDTKGVYCPPLLAYSYHDYSPSVFVVKFEEDSQPLQVCELTAMKSGKASPLVVEVEKTLYVLAGTPVVMLPEPAFEAYNIIEKKWEGHDSPRFLQCNSKYFKDPQICSFVVIKKTIHVSTSSSSYSYDTEGRKWSRCALFDDAPPELRRPWVDDVPIPFLFNWMDGWITNKDEEKDYGLPFSFDGGAVLYGENVLIGLVPSLGVVAYKLVDGKVKYYKSLEDLEIPSDPTLLAYLADFKEGNLCLVFILGPVQALKEGNSVISIKPFQVFKPGNGLRRKDENTKILNWSDDDHDKLNDKNRIYYRVGKTIYPEFTQEQELANKNWSPICCFAL